MTPDDLLACYRAGVFPMAEGRDDPGLFLVDPPERGVFPLGGWRPPRRLARTVRADVLTVTLNGDFPGVVDACATPGPGREETWINAPIRSLYLDLHRRGFAHSLECRRAGVLVGGLYGVSIGGAFFGESMFSRETDASKVALVHLIGRLLAGGFRLLDAQFLTPHLASLGAIEIARAEYRRRLAAALAAAGDLYALPAATTGAGVLQAISHRS